MSENQPLVSIDVVPVKFDKEQGCLVWGTAKRLYEPYLGEQALPGVLLLPGEGILAASARALRDKAALSEGVFHQFGAFDGTNRDPRGATISIALLSGQPSNADSDRVTWHKTLEKLPFDHNEILKAGETELSAVLWKNIPLTRVLLGEEFSTLEAIQIGSPTPISSNVGRWLTASGLVEETGETRRTKWSGRPSKVWKWK